MENVLHHGKYQWDLELDEQTMKNDEVYGICESGVDTLVLNPNETFVYNHFNSYSSEDRFTGDSKCDMKTMKLEGKIIVESDSSWICEIEKSECRIGGPKEIIGKFKVIAMPGGAVKTTEAAVTDK